MSRRFLFFLIILIAVVTGTRNLAASTTLSSPRELVSLYSILDFEGKRLRSGTEMLELVTWEEEPGWDHLVLVNSFSILAIEADADSATVAVEYIMAGTMDGGGLDMHEQPIAKTVTFRLRKISGQWKIHEPRIPPHVATEIALSHISRLANN